jgi:hypothetical protein
MIASRPATKSMLRQPSAHISPRRSPHRTASSVGTKIRVPRIDAISSAFKMIAVLIS